MSVVIVTVHCASLAQPMDLELPATIPLSRLVPELVKALRLPDGIYALMTGSRILAASETLSTAGVLTGDRLVLRVIRLSRPFPKPTEWERHLVHLRVLRSL